MNSYQKIGLVVVLSDGGQAFSNELRLDLLTPYHDLHAWLQV